MNCRFISSIITVVALSAMSQVMAQDVPEVITDKRFARGATMAFTRGTFKAVNGNTITERGFCWSSTSKEPTIDDARSTSYFSNSGVIFRLKDLEPATRYYVRAYAIAKDGSVGYGDAIKIITLPKGTITYAYDEGGSEAENKRIRTAVASAVDYWNNLTSISGLYLNVHYGAQTPTADCSYGGWMRVGPNASYQQIGTIMHEALHAIGVGTHAIWNGATSPMRAGSGTGQWLGDRANEFLQFWDNSTTAVLKGDATHLWPYGINGAHEDNGTEALYYGCSLLAQAVGEDGLPCTTSRAFGTPAYVFDQEDDVKYYIKNESASYGLYNSYLVETADHRLKWRTMTAEEAAANDAAAWYVSFTPRNQYYQFRNASSGYYITCPSSGSLTAVSCAQPSSSEDFHLMRSRVDVATSSGIGISSVRGYWIIRPDNASSNPDCVSASALGSVTTAAFNLSNAAKAQRWLIMTAAEAMQFEQEGLTAARNEFRVLRQHVEALSSVPHRLVRANADEVLSSTIDSLSLISESSAVISDITSLSDALIRAARVYLTGVCVTSAEQLFDLTFLLANPSFDDNTTGWIVSAGAGCNYKALEYFEKSANVSQTLSLMPAGTYQLVANALHRPGDYTSVYKAYQAGQDDASARLYISSPTKAYTIVRNLMADRSPSRLHAEDKAMADGTFVPNTMASAVAYFEAGRYRNVVEYYLPSAADCKFGIVAPSNTGAAHWLMFDDFHLYSMGVTTREELEATAIEPLSAEALRHSAEGGVFDLYGRRLSESLPSLPSGFYVRDGHKVIVR